MIFYSTGVIWPEQIQILYTQEPIKVGLYSIATGASGALASPIIGKIITRVDQTRTVLVIAVALLTLVSGLQAIVSTYYAREVHVNAADETPSSRQSDCLNYHRMLV